MAVYNIKNKKKRGVTKKTKGKSKLTAQAVAKIARAVTMKAAETKSYITSVADTVTDNVYRTVCVNYGIGQGAASEQKLGEKIFVKNLRIKGKVFQTSSGGASMLQRIGRIVVFRSKKNLATSNPATLTRSDLMRTGGASYISADHVDLHKVNLLYDQTFLFPLQNATDQYTNHLIDINIPINKTCYFDSDTTNNYFKNEDIYIAYAIYTNGGITTPGTYIFNYSLNFKDE